MRKHWIMLTISFICIVIVPLGWIAQTLISERINPQASDGKIDLTQWDFDRKGVASLKGIWDFYPGQLLSPADIEASVSGRKPLPASSGTQVPARWNKSLGQAHGYGTYHLQVQLTPRTMKMIMVYAHRIYAWPTGYLSMGKRLAAKACQERPRQQIYN